MLRSIWNSICYARSISPRQYIAIAAVVSTHTLSAQPGAIDSTFRFVKTSVFPSALSIQSDGRVLIGGGFNQVDGQSIDSLARLNTDGTVDKTLAVGKGVQLVTDAITLPGGIVLLPASTVSGSVNSLDVQADGKIVVVGNFNRYDGVPAVNIARLNPNGTIDPSFVTGTGLDAGGTFVKVLPDGRFWYREVRPIEVRR